MQIYAKKYCECIVNKKNFLNFVFFDINNV